MVKSINYRTEEFISLMEDAFICCSEFTVVDEHTPAAAAVEWSMAVIDYHGRFSYDNWAPQTSCCSNNVCLSIYLVAPHWLRTQRKVLEGSKISRSSCLVTIFYLQSSSLGLNSNQTTTQLSMGKSVYVIQLDHRICKHDFGRFWSHHRHNRQL